MQEFEAATLRARSGGRIIRIRGPGKTEDQPGFKGRQQVLIDLPASFFADPLQGFQVKSIADAGRQAQESSGFRGKPVEPVNQQIHHILGHRQEFDGSQLPGPLFFLRGVTDQVLLGEYGQKLAHKEGIATGFAHQDLGQRICLLSTAVAGMGEQL